ncbi:EAL and HDOD domain-containing protein [Teredinibacter turnerae]|uniref:EAL and HDOD domain-containing protein n=1 Tax=Teredinibacter turnerae TaxID=2426 RepID=UPI0003A674E3|nr:HDOD domain-containing protein [Teredinibacter turnerae]
MPDVVPLFARQPIFDRSYEVVAYELLFRQSHANAAEITDGDMATAQVLLKVFGENQIQEVIGNHKAFVNYTRKLVCTPPPLPSKQLVVELLEDIPFDNEVAAGLKKLRRAGYEIALDDFELTAKTQPLLAFADIVKVDVLAHSREGLAAIVEHLRPYNKTLLAEKVEDHQTMQFCLELGFKLFQGYFLCKPQIVQGISVSEGKQAIIKLISVLNDPEVEFDTIVQTIATDPSLSYKILRLVNSSAIGLPRHVESLNQAVTLLGLSAIRNWASYLLMANSSDKPRELCVISMSRAKFCEQLAKQINGRAMADAGFTVGLLYNLDAFLDMPMAELMERLRLAENLSEAIIHQRGTLGEILQNVLHFERAQWQHVNWKFFAEYSIDEEQLTAIYSNSIHWATETVSSQV